MMFKQVVMRIGVDTFTMEALVKTQIAHERSEMQEQKDSDFSLQYSLSPCIIHLTSLLPSFSYLFNILL